MSSTNLQIEREAKCPVCGGTIHIRRADSLTRCPYCGSLVLGNEQKRTCKNHPDRKADGVCSVCNNLFCSDCLEKRVGEYGGKFFTIFVCKDPSCQTAVSWTTPVDEKLTRLASFDWADRYDNWIVKSAGIGGILLVFLELFMFFVFSYLRYWSSWGMSHLSMWYVVGFTFLGTFIAAILLQVALQVYDHNTQFSSGVLTIVLTVLYYIFWTLRFEYFNFISYPNPLLWVMLEAVFLFSVILLITAGTISAIVGRKKQKQLKKLVSS